VNKSQEAAVKVTAPAEVLEALQGFGTEVLEELFIVSGVELQAGDELACEVLRAPGEKCPRCWNYRDLGGNAAHPAVCQRCGDVLEEIGFTEE
jgi:isoleucyl-tRNA synthetase